MWHGASPVGEARPDRFYGDAVRIVVVSGHFPPNFVSGGSLRSIAATEVRHPDIMAGVTQCIMLSLSMVVIAALVGADGLGKPVVRALNSVNIAMGFEAGLAIVILAIVLDRVFKQPERRGKEG